MSIDAKPLAVRNIAYVSIFRFRMNNALRLCKKMFVTSSLLSPGPRTVLPHVLRIIALHSFDFERNRNRESWANAKMFRVHVLFKEESNANLRVPSIGRRERWRGRWSEDCRALARSERRCSLVGRAENNEIVFVMDHELDFLFSHLAIDKKLQLQPESKRFGSPKTTFTGVHRCQAGYRPGNWR